VVVGLGLPGPVLVVGAAAGGGVGARALG
jgi:hypothetical protein